MSASATALNDVPIFSTTRGIFDNAAPVSIDQVGTMNIVFNSCTTMTLTYSFTSGDNVGLVGTTTLSRLGSIRRVAVCKS